MLALLPQLISVVALIVLFSSTGLSKQSISYYFGDKLADPPTAPVPFPNVQYAGRGYDIYRGNPHSTYGPDPGFRAQVLNLSASTAYVSDDGRFLVPNGTQTFPDVSCRMDWVAEMITSSAEYASSLAVSVEIDISSFYGAFAASLDYKQVAERTGSETSSFTKVAAECSLYTITINRAFVYITYYGDQALFSLTNDYITAVDSMGLNYLPTIPDNILERFVGRFGTNIPLKAVMGARYGQQTEISSIAMSSKSQTEIKAAAKASARFGASVSAMVDYQVSEAAQFSQESTTQSLFSVGAPPPANGDANSWAAQAITDPIPIRLKNLVGIADPINILNFPSRSYNVYSVRGQIETYLGQTGTYCQQTAGTSCTKNVDVVEACFGGWFVIPSNQILTKRIVNPLTGRLSCPVGYSAYPFSLNNPSVMTEVPVLFLCRPTNPIPSCVPEADSFGGMYTLLNGNTGNPWAGYAQGCPSQFTSICPSTINTYNGISTGTYLCICINTQYTAVQGFKAYYNQPWNSNGPLWNPNVYFNSVDPTIDCPLNSQPYLFLSTATSSSCGSQAVCGSVNIYICLSATNSVFEQLPPGAKMVYPQYPFAATLANHNLTAELASS